MNLVRTRDGRNYLTPFLLVTTLFFLWGFAHSILDVLNKYFQDALHLTKTESAYIQAVVYGGYFLMALPAGASFAATATVPACCSALSSTASGRCSSFPARRS